jgi:ribose/xylose/arabinose/galactoside ABC-type transport system permease subunit
MRILDVPAYWQRILQGVLLLGIIIVDRVTANRRARGGPPERTVG